ncbi:MAG: hypothetical protein ACE365_02400 [Gammaproteobacteria bacterium]
MKNILLLLFILPAFVFAFPKNCTTDNIVYDKGVLKIANKKQAQQVILIQNKSKQVFWLNHEMPQPSASAGWASRIQPGHWSALALDKNTFSLVCTAMKPGDVYYFDCQKKITACQLASTKVTQLKINGGTYWWREDMTKEQLHSAIKEYKAKNAKAH